MATELITNINLETDGDWAFTDGLRDAYFNGMFVDGGFEGRLAIFDNLDAALACIDNVLGQVVDGGIYRSSEYTFDSDAYYINGISKVREFYADPGLRERVSQDIEESLQMENADDRLGGVEIFTDCDNWSSKTALYLRVDGRISSDVSTYFFPNGD